MAPLTTQPAVRELVWGYRATRGGEVLRLATTDGRDFVVTMPDAGSAAALVNAELDRVARC